MIIGNFTKDDIPWMHIGVNGVIPAYDPDDPEKKHVVEMESGRGRFILNSMGRRGLVQMQFGDDEKVKRDQSIALYNRFWERQITAQNQFNEGQKEKGQRYAKPSQELVDHAEDLGLELISPWTVKKARSEDPGVIDALKKENDSLKESVSKMEKQMDKLMTMMEGKLSTETKEPAPVDTEKELKKTVAANRKKYERLLPGTMLGWVKNNWSEIQKMPEENRFEITTKYEEIYQTPYPAERPM